MRTTGIALHIGSGISVLDGSTRTQIADGFRCSMQPLSGHGAAALTRREEKPLRGHAPPVSIEED